MKLQDKPLRYVRVGRRVYRLNLTFGRVLRAMEAAQDPALNDHDRQRVMLRLMVRHPRPMGPRRQAALLQAILAQLEPEEASRPGPPLLSLTQDAPLIRGAFRQAYGIDLTQDHLHWTVFCELFSALPTGTRLADVIAIRARPMPPPTKTNARERQQLMAAKAEVALRLSDEEKARALRQGKLALAQGMLALAKRGERKK
ncbi:MAG: Gp15 family bacteriophage protein [Aristaeellaceae bacterium]